MMPSQQLYFLATIEHGYVGNAVVFWRDNSKGYTADVDNAGFYLADEVKEICDGKYQQAWGIPTELVLGASRRYLAAREFLPMRLEHGLTRASERVGGGSDGE